MSAMYFTGTCKCNDGFDGDTCFINISDPLILDDIDGNGICDLKMTDHCHECLRIQTKYLSRSFICRIDMYHVSCKLLNCLIF